MTFVGYLILGIAAGLLGGAFGIGGGVLIMPVLIVLFKQSYHVAVGTSLLVIIAISIAGALRHWTLENINFHIAVCVAVGGILGAVLGASIVEKIPPIYAKRALAVFLTYTAIRLWVAK